MLPNLDKQGIQLDKTTNCTIPKKAGGVKHGTVRDYKNLFVYWKW